MHANSIEFQPLSVQCTSLESHIKDTVIFFTVCWMLVIILFLHEWKSVADWTSFFDAELSKYQRHFVFLDCHQQCCDVYS